MEKVYRFGKFTLNTAEETFHAGERAVHLPAKEYEILRVLVENNGRVVTKEEMLRAVWRDTFVEESNLAQYVSRLRKILNTDGCEFIKTFPKRGYRFTAALAVSDGERVRRHVRLTVGGAERPPAARLGEIRELAVLPFRALGAPAADDGILGLGITDALITRLARARQLVVRPTTTILRYREAPRTPSEIAAELRVDAVLDGNFQRLGKRLRLTVQLLGAAGETPLWAEVFTTEIGDLFAVQDEIAGRIGAALDRRLSAESRGGLKKSSAEEAGAYQEYLKGRFYLLRRDPESLELALAHFERAIAAAPGYALAHAGLAEATALLPLVDARAPRSAFPRAKAAVLRALELDPELVEAHTWLGTCLMSYDFNWAGAEVSFRRAIELDPNHAAGRQVYATYLLRRARIAEAIVELRRAQALDPLSPVVNTWLAEALAHLGEYEASILLHRETLKFSPDYFMAYYHLTFTYLLAGRTAHAVETSKEALRLSRGISLARFAAVSLHAVLGETAQARALLAGLLAERDAKYVSAVNIASCFGALGDAERTLAWLETGLAERDPNLTWIGIDKEFAFVRRAPRFRAVLRALDLDL